MIKKVTNKLRHLLSKAKSKDILKNVFATDFDKNVLISYLQAPFIKGINYRHTNVTECYTAAEIFSALGYNVDVIEYNNNAKVNFSSYQVVYGQAYPFEKSFFAVNANSKRILYGTGNSHYYFVKVSGKVVYDFYKKTGIMVPESARVDNSYSFLPYTCSDAIIALGNQFCKNTYLEINPALNCYNLDAFYFDTYDIDVSKKDFSVPQKHFLWFGSGGLLYKGLGLCIDLFSRRKDIVLHICGAGKNEKAFWEYYQPMVDKAENIIEHGFVDINSDAFKAIMDTCVFTLFPSVSEGGSPSLLNVMANGALIPIAARACTVDIDDFGFVLEEVNEQTVEKAIDKALQLTKNELAEKAQLAKETTRLNYTLDKYKQNLRIIIEDILSK